MTVIEATGEELSAGLAAPGHFEAGKVAEGRAAMQIAIAVQTQPSHVALYTTEFRPIIDLCCCFGYQLLC